MLNGTFKRCAGYVTLGLVVYVPLLRKMVKLVSMEEKSEAEENCVNTLITKNFGLFNFGH